MEDKFRSLHEASISKQSGLDKLDTRLVLESSLDPRSGAFKQAVKLTPGTLAYYRTNGRWIPAEHLLYVSSLLASEISQGGARIIVECPPRHGKPYCVSSFILMRGGVYKRLGDVKVGDYVITHTGNPRRVLAVHEQGFLPTLLIATRSGRKLHPALDHPHLTSLGWKTAAELAPGDELIVLNTPDNQPSFHSEDTVVSVAPGTLRECRCLTVDIDETFTVQNVIVHNSELISINTPIWFLEKYPWANVILSSYGADLAAGFGRQVRDVFLENPRKIFDTTIRSDVQRTSLFLTSENGGMISAGVGGTITGKGAHLLIIDDYVKNWTEAISTVQQETIWNWWRSTAYSRLEPNGSVVILATRWALNDLIGRIRAEDKEHLWHIIRLPALAGENDVLNRAPGQALWPERYNEKALNEIRQVVGQFIFQALYQQDPQPEGSQQIDTSMLRIVDTLENPERFRWVRSWDLAATDESKKKGDYTVGSLVGTNERASSPVALTAIADMIRGRWEPADIELTMQQTAASDGPQCPIIIEQEPGASGKAYAQHLASNVLRGYRVHITPAQRNKWIRAQPYAAAVSHGRIQMLRATWNEAHIKELKDAPNGTHDDTLDSVSQAFNHLHLVNHSLSTWGRHGTKAPTDAMLDTVGSDVAPNNVGRSSPLLLPSTSSNVISGVVFGRRVF